MKSIIPFVVLFVLFLAWPIQAAEPVRVTLAPAEVNRRYVAMEENVAMQPPFVVRDLETSKDIPCQWRPGEKPGTYRVHWLLDHVEAGMTRKFSVQKTRTAEKGGMTIAAKEGYLSIASGQREITRYYFGELADKHKKPYMYPVLVGHINVCRGFPMDPHPNESTDHPHHTGVWFAHGEVNKMDFWAKDPIKHEKFIYKDSGPVLAHMVAENNWGKLVQERQDIRVYNIGDDTLMDWEITLEAVNRPVILGKTKEGGFSVRVNTGLTSPDPGKTAAQQKDRANGKIVDAEGHGGEDDVREHAAPWADDFGEIGGKVYGVALMNHPKSFRYPTNWHVRNYGLFAANAFFTQGEYTLEPGKPITLRYRLFAHAGGPKDAHVQEVYNGYAITKTERN